MSRFTLRSEPPCAIPSAATSGNDLHEPEYCLRFFPFNFAICTRGKLPKRLSFATSEVAILVRRFSRYESGSVQAFAVPGHFLHLRNPGRIRIGLKSRHLGPVAWETTSQGQVTAARRNRAIPHAETAFSRMNGYGTPHYGFAGSAALHGSFG